MKKFIALALMALMLIGCFAGCASESTKVKVIDLPLSSEEYAFAVAQNDTEFLGKVNAFLKKIKEDGTFDKICNNYFGDGTPLSIESAALDETKEQLVVATSTGFEPFEMVDANGKYSGVDLEIAYYLAKELNLELVIQDMDFEAVVNSVQSGKSDIAMAGLTITEKRQKVVTFSDSYYNASQVVITMEDDTTFDDCKTGEDVAAILAELDKTSKIGCQTGTTGEFYIKGDEDLGFDGLKAEAATYKYVALAITAMQQGQVKYVIADNGPAKAITEKFNGQ
ncbi:MAG: transporter substrate-binding domain-containing protein [Clostridia bacterium]|nr:transporter substrate-binding domain-containing protein [Oscillospiraceae bacterium]MBO5357773.1 transporter substrate-binding domain-containing protein [Clostridia bacterium]